MTPTVRRLLRRPDRIAVREQIARRYLSGEGIEVGALNTPLRVPEGCRVRYVDSQPFEGVKNTYQGVSDVLRPDIVSDLETLDGIDDSSLDFVVACHVLEHVENPLRALASIARVLRADGIAFIALPDKHYTFDKRRDVTTLEHIVCDYEDGPEWSRQAHYLDWAANVERVRDPKARAAECERNGQNIHFHVFDLEAMRTMFDYAASLPEIRLEVAHFKQTRSEVIWILRKYE